MQYLFCDIGWLCQKAMRAIGEWWEFRNEPKVWRISHRMYWRNSMDIILGESQEGGDRSWRYC